ncbi:tyrosine-type recombinase/integrase [Actinomadura hibisca]|uniref:tyrosine-type recombinase/integrase n=1 Tax=Actinomadura hibisca TaxID=68565 RepID=UPI0008356C73|nr:site-specific integrase [Actinomadura hibisca]
MTDVFVPADDFAAGQASARPSVPAERPQPTPLPTAAPADAAQLRQMLIEAVTALPALPPPDPTDRYAPRHLTVLWLEKLNSHHTRRAYWRALTSWLTFCHRTALDPLAARAADVDAWISLQTATGPDGAVRPAKPNTLAQRKAAVSAWYTYLARNQVTDRNPGALATPIKVADTATKAPVLSAPQTAQLLDWAEQRAMRLDTEPAWRDVVVIAILFYVGVRVSALTDADVDDLTEEAGYRILRYGKKGGGRSYVRVEADIIRPLQHYLRLRAAREGVPVTELSGPLLVTTPHPYRPELTGGKRLTQRAVSDTIRTLAGQAGLPTADRLSPHSGRGTVITTMLANGVPLRKAQEHADHRNPQTTAGYDQGNHRLAGSPIPTLAAIIDQHRTPPELKEP